MKRFSTTVSRWRDEEASVTRFQLQTDAGPAVRPDLDDLAHTKPLRRYELQTDNAAAFVPRGDQGYDSDLSPLSNARPSQRKELK